nr:MAG TPA: hypothetical protein [Bacteriophage sp.]
MHCFTDIRESEFNNIPGGAGESWHHSPNINKRVYTSIS